MIYEPENLKNKRAIYEKRDKWLIRLAFLFWAVLLFIYVNWGIGLFYCRSVNLHIYQIKVTKHANVTKKSITTSVNHSAGKKCNVEVQRSNMDHHLKRVRLMHRSSRCGTHRRIRNLRKRSI